MDHVAIFGKRYSCLNSLSIMLNDVESPALREAGRYFKSFFPDHASGENTSLYVLRKSNGYDLVWTCSHFECTQMEYIEKLYAFLKKLSFLSGEDSASLDLLDAFAEKLIILVPDVDKDIFTLRRY